MNEAGIGREQGEGEELSRELDGEMNITIADRIKHLKEYKNFLELEADEAETDSTKQERANVNEVLNQFIQLQEAIGSKIFPPEKLEELFLKIEEAYEKLEINTDLYEI